MKMRRKPTVIDTVQFTGENEEEIYAAFGAEFFDYLGDGDGWMLMFTTAHGDQAYARTGDWIVPDAQPGTFYPIKDSVMQSSYEPFSYDEELTEDSEKQVVLDKVRSTLMVTLPMTQVDIAMAKLVED